MKKDERHIKGFGGADAARILNLNGKKYVTDKYFRARLLYLLGRGERPEIPDTPAMRAGREYEDYFFANVFPCYFTENKKDTEKWELQHYLLPDLQCAGVQLLARADAYNADTGEVIELKYSEKSTDEVLERYAAQLQWYYFCGARQVTLVHAMKLPDCGDNFAYTPIKICKIKKIREADADFLIALKYIEEVIIPKLDPDAGGYAGEVEKCDLPDEMRIVLRELIDAQQIVAKNEIIVKECKEKLQKYMNDVEIYKIKGEDVEVSSVAATVSKTFDKKSFFSKHPEADSPEFYKETTRAGYLKVTLL